MSKSRAVVILGLAGAIGVGGGIAAASIPAPGGTIHASYVNANLLNGTLQLVDAVRAGTLVTIEDAQWAEAELPARTG